MDWKLVLLVSIIQAAWRPAFISCLCERSKASDTKRLDTKKKRLILNDVLHDRFARRSLGLTVIRVGKSESMMEM